VHSKLYIIGILVLLLLPFAYAVDKENGVIVNSKNWRELFLGVMYAGINDADFYYFQDLSDAQIKSQSMPRHQNLEVYESRKKPVVKGFEKFLAVNGFKNYDTTKYNNFEDLQEILYLKDDHDKIILFDTQFGIEAITAAPFMLLVSTSSSPTI